MAKVSLFAQHVNKWNGCTKCELHEHRTKMVFAKGKLPCDLLFIGEAPGRSEDVLGIPFVGPAGKLLDEIIADSIPTDLRLAFTNLVCCIPLDETGLEKISEPHKEHIEACKWRLSEFASIAKPRLYVCVGQLSRKWIDKVIPHRTTPLVEIVHPAAILRQPNEAMKSFAIKKAIVTLQAACAGLE